MAKHKYPRPDPTGPWWLPPADKLEAAGFKCDPTSRGTIWSWYSAGDRTGGWHVYLGLHGNGWLFIYNTRHTLHLPPLVTTVADGSAFTELLTQYGWVRPAK